ncbi:MAG: serine hydrolase, partial [Anaerolineales bacterium]
MFSLKRFTSNVAVMLVVCAMFASGCSTLSAQFDPNTLTLTPTAIPKGDYWPTEGWRTTTPEEQRIDSVKLEKMMGDIEKNNYAIESVIIVRNGYIVLEGYPNPEYGPNDRHVLWSATKSVTSALIGIAIKEGFIDSINQTMVDFFPERKIEDIDAGKRQITIEHLLTMTPGYQWGDRTGKPMRNNPNPVQFVLDRPMVSDPGREFNYGDGASHLLSAIIGNTTGSSALDFADAYLFEPLGISNVEWKSDPQGVNFGGSGLFMTPRDMAKVGYLYLNDGIWEGDQLLPKDWVERSTKPINVSSWNGHGYGYQWWTLAQGGVHFAHGLYGQSIFVIP